MMQGIHHQQQQLAALLTAALPKDDSAKATAASSSATTAASAPPPSEEDEAPRISAINSLHGAILYPPNSILITHSASFLAQGFSQLLSDKSYSVRHAAATAYGALCSVLCSISAASNGRQNHAILGSLIDRFIGWSLPSLNNTINGTSELALESLREFLNVGDAGAVERYSLPILKSCQELLEDERTSAKLLPRLLGLLTLISLKFFRCFQPHFMDIVDLLLGWAMVPDISESDKRVIMDSFLQFQKHWVNNMRFSLGLLSKFLGDMDVLLQDGGPGTPQQFKRLLALLSCFCTVLQSVASGLLEINFLEQISEPLSQMVPLLLGCLSMVGRKFGWSKWVEESWRCLTLLAEILGERFCTFYTNAVDILFQCLEVENVNHVKATQKLSSFQVHGVLKTNLQLLSLQKLGLMPSSVHKILQFNGTISQMRLHPNHLVTGSAAATYIFLLQHGKDDVVEKTIDSLVDELQLLKCNLEENIGKSDELMIASKHYFTYDLIVLMKFNLKVLLSCVALRHNASFWQRELANAYVTRAQKLILFISDKLDPFDVPMQSSVELQVTVLSTLKRLATIEFMSKCSRRGQKTQKNASETSSRIYEVDEDVGDLYPAIVYGHLRRYSELLIKALDISSPLAVKLEALEWMNKFCESVIEVHENIKPPFYPCQVVTLEKSIEDLLLSTLAAASDKEPKVRFLVATAVEMLLKAKIIPPTNFPFITEKVLERLGDPEKDIKNVYLGLFSRMLPVAIYICGLCNFGATSTCPPRVTWADKSSLLWKQVFALKQLPQKLHSQQLVTVLSYISQRWKVSLSSWILRLIHTCRSKKEHPLTQSDEAEVFCTNDLWWDIKVEEDILERICSTNLLAGAWWAIHEAARFCIGTRLRTNLGGPTQTFAALERMLLDITHVLRLETEQNDGNLSIIGSYAHLLPMRLLLEFVEALKKNVYNAYEGSSILPHASRTSALFFQSNKKVCEEWFSRINDPMMHAGLALQCHDATIHYCALRLQDLHKFVTSTLTDKLRIQMTEHLQNIRDRYAGDILSITRNMALALCKNLEPEALVGLQKWAAVAFSPLFGEENEGPNDSKISGPFSWITGLVYQAQSQHEKAAAHFIHLLQSDESLTSMGSDGIQFVIARIIESYTSISDWKSLESWLSELQNVRAKYAGRNFAGALTTAGSEINSIQAMARFDEGDFQAAWSYLDLTPKSSNELTLDPRLALQRSEQMLLQAMLLHREGKVEKVPEELQKAKLMLEEVFSVFPLDGPVEAAPHVNQLFCISAFEEGYRLGDSKDTAFLSHLGTYIQTRQFPCNHLYQDCTLWLKVLRVCQNTLPTSNLTLEICKDLMILARKQGNLMLAARLSNYLKAHASLCSDEGFQKYLISCLEYEDILLIRVENKLEHALMKLWSFIRVPMVSNPSVACNSHDNLLKAKACMKLSQWLEVDCLRENMTHIVLEMQSGFNRSQISSPGREAITTSDNKAPKPGVHLIVEELVGTARKLSTHLCPKMGKSWILYGSWCYTQAIESLSSSSDKALHSCSFSPLLDTDLRPERFRLTAQEQSCVKECILQLIPRHDEIELTEERGDCNNLATQITNDSELKLLLPQIVDVIETAAGAAGAEDFSSDSLSAAVSSQLQKCIISANISLDDAKIVSAVDELVDIWRSLRRRRVSLFGQAAQAFLNYLSYSHLKYFGVQPTVHDVTSKHKYASCTLRAMLYVLRILVNYGVELKDILEPALLKVPLLPWQELTPQLFARLSSHPNKVVRKQIETLLLMLAKISPRSLVYPTLVDANSPEKEPSEELQNILAYLNQLYPRLVQDAQLMIKELDNVTVLWEELWLGTLQDLYADVMRRINLLKEEAARIAENTTLSHVEKNKINAAKYSAMMAPIVVVLERRLTSTSRKPETPHELWFVDEYQEPIKSALTKFKTPPASVAALGDVWRPFETIAASLASYQRKSSISLGEVAPQLASLLSSDAPMPGLEKQVTISNSENSSDSIHPEIVTIASFSDELAILPTKTKPKKLAMLGSDGLKYTYLLKGREDLRLDARIMQLLQAIDGFLQSSSAMRGRSPGIRFYSVTPISGRAGLIQWVDNVISIYSIFKSWQKRVQLSQLSALGTDANADVPPVPRPGDMFYGKIIPALKEKGIKRVISRRDWPHDVKRKVLLDLMAETPKQLLHQELWCASEGFRAFSSKVKRYSGSVAAMSIIGHILGLGDRHLDNILIDFRHGDIVHIDYNVCFDKGQKLKIPEIVPFRLTQIIEAALGLTGVEGSFRANCEAVLGVLRRNKDIILMLLEVFVSDPLVEWTRANFHDDAAVVGEERKGMELAVSLSLFASRVQEIRVALQEHHDLLLSTLPAVESAIERFADILHQYEIVYNHFYHVDQEHSNLVQNETSAKSVVAEALSNSEKTHALFEIQAREFTQVQAMVMERSREAATWIEQHGRVLEALRSNLIPEIKAYIKLTGSEEALSLRSAVHGAGVPLTVVPEPTQIHCLEIDKEVSLSVAELNHGLSSAVAALQIYSLALQRILPLNYVTTSPVYSWAQVFLSLNTLSSEAITLARRQGAELVSKGHTDEFNHAKDRYDDLCRKVMTYVEDIERLEEERAELVMSLGSETESHAKERFLSDFMKYMEHAGLTAEEDSTVCGTGLHGVIDATLLGEVEEKKKNVVNILVTAVRSLFSDVKHRIQTSLDRFGREGITVGGLQFDIESFVNEFEEHIEKCEFVNEVADELNQNFGLDICGMEADENGSKYASQGNWASIFKNIVLLSKNLVEQMAEVVVPSVLKSVVSNNSDVIDIFGSISQIRASVDTALEQLIEVEMERVSLIELESNYFVKVGRITEKQLALEEASFRGRDHLSWEEAEELASQEEACKVQLDKLHQSWNQKDVRTSSLLKKQANINGALVASEFHLQSLISAEPEQEPHSLRRKALIASLVEPFSELETVDQVLMSISGPVKYSSGRIPYPVDSIYSGCSASEYIWRFPDLLHGHAFFIWKVSIVDLLLDSCTHDAATSFDQSLGFDQLVDTVKEKLRNQLWDHIGKYLMQRIAPMILTRLDREIENIWRVSDSREGLDGQLKIEIEAVRRVQLMLEEYCNAHETFRAARAAATIMKRQVNELKNALLRIILDITQMEWMCHNTLRPLENTRLISHKFLVNDDKLVPVMLNLSRPKLMETIQSSVAKVARALECLKSCEGTSMTAEGQLERAMSWACGGPSSSLVGNVSARNLGIPPEFHDHLIKRRQLLQESRENASDIMKVCISILEFEASRDGHFRPTIEISPSRTGLDGMWQQSYLGILTKLDVAYHSFTRAEQELQTAQRNMEAASSCLVSATNELCLASVKAKSASGDLQSTLLAMRDSAYEASVALSAYVGVIRGHNALTSECGSMIEEVLAITEDLPDVQSFGKEASVSHCSLMEGLSKANAVLIPLESLLSKDVSAMTDAMAREKETKMEISPIHGQAIFQSYHNRVKETLHVFRPLVPSLTLSVQELYLVLTKLARVAGLHAGNLHKALEGLGESLQDRTQDIGPLRSDLSCPAAEFDTQDSEPFLKSEGENDGNSFGLNELVLSDRGWISPPESIGSSITVSDVTSAEGNIVDTFVSLEVNAPVSGCSQESSCGPPNLPLSVTAVQELALGETDSEGKLDRSNAFSMPKDEPVLNQDKAEEVRKISFINMETSCQAQRSKNAYALSILRRVEMKLDGRDITDDREMSISEQVDFLLRQATNVDNLCNMYEGWTPWI